MKEAFYIAQSGRPGPVVIDMPKNVQEARMQPVFRETIKLRGYTPERRADDVALNEIIGLIKKSQATGDLLRRRHHHRRSESKELAEFAERDPDSGDDDHHGGGRRFRRAIPLSLRWLGMHGTVYANNAANEADLLLAFGVRFDDRVTGKVEKFCEHGTIVHIDIDNSEINKNKHVQLPILSDVSTRWPRPTSCSRRGWVQATRVGRKARRCSPEWYAQIAKWKAETIPMQIQGYRGRDPAAVRHRAALRADQGRADHHDRRGPASDVGRPVVPVRRAAHASSQRRARRDGLWLSRRPRRQGRASRQGGGRHRRRRLVPDEHPGTGHGVTSRRLPPR